MGLLHRDALFRRIPEGLYLTDLDRPNEAVVMFQLVRQHIAFSFSLP